MKKKLFVANWKEHKTISQAREWIHEFGSLIVNNPLDLNIEVVLCPSFMLLPSLAYEIKNLRLPVVLGSQDFPAFDEGAYTGEESPRSLKEFVRYAIIGHSERRKTFGETDELLTHKVTLAKEYEVAPIYCVQSEKTYIPKNVSIVAYEPVFAIGTGTPDTPENANQVIESVMSNLSESIGLYGGSVTSENVSAYIHENTISGVLVGSASLNPRSFFDIVTK